MADESILSRMVSAVVEAIVPSSPSSEPNDTDETEVCSTNAIDDN